MTPLFRAARQNRIFQDVVEQIQEAIIDGRLQVGDRLPAERELKEMLETSRSTLREALRVLEQKGLIEIKLGMGGGAVVKAVTPDLVSESLDLLIRSHQVSLRHIAEFRERMEGDVVALATQRMTAQDKKELQRLLEVARKCVSRGIEAVPDFLTADKNLHLFFARKTHNPIYISILKTIHENIRRYYDEYLVMEAPVMHENMQDLEDLATAAMKGDVHTAGDIARNHIQRFSGYMEMRDRREAK